MLSVMWSERRTCPTTLGEAPLAKGLSDVGAVRALQDLVFVGNLHR